MIAGLAVLAPPQARVYRTGTATAISRSTTATYFRVYASGFGQSAKMGYAGACVEDENEASGIGVENHRQTGLHP
jgi:hypothetical protein